MSDELERKRQEKIANFKLTLEKNLQRVTKLAVARLQRATLKKGQKRYLIRW